MNRFFLSSDRISGGEVSFPDDISHQISHVLRLKAGDVVAVLDNLGHLYQVSLVLNPHTNRPTGRVLGRELVDTEPQTRVALCFGLSNRDKVEWVLQKATEIGVVDFFPFVSSHTLVKSTTLSSKKLVRWERIIREAAEQSHRGRLPVLNRPLDYSVCLAEVKNQYRLCLIAWEGAVPGKAPLSSTLNGYEGDSIAVFVGPEGGFSVEEMSTAREMGWQVISLGSRILRMETAAIVLPALVLHEMGD